MQYLDLLLLISLASPVILNPARPSSCPPSLKQSERERASCSPSRVLLLPAVLFGPSSYTCELGRDVCGVPAGERGGLLVWFGWTWRERGDRRTPPSPQPLPLMSPLPLTPQGSSVYSLTFDEFQSALGRLGKDFGSMNMGELLRNISPAEEPHAIGAVGGGGASSSAVPDQAIQRQGSLMLPMTLSQKTVDEVRRELFGGPSASAAPSLAQRQQTLEEMTLEELLVHSGMLQKDMDWPPPVSQAKVPAAAAAPSTAQRQQAHGDMTLEEFLLAGPPPVSQAPVPAAAAAPSLAQRQQTPGEMTLEEFLVRAGVVREDMAGPPPVSQAPVPAARPPQPQMLFPQSNMFAPMSLQRYWKDLYPPEENSYSHELIDAFESDSDELVDALNYRVDIKPNVLDDILYDQSAEPVSLPLSLLQDISHNFANERIIGQGGFAVVYKGVLRNRSVAIKKLLNSKTIDDEPFYRETNFLMSVKHENIVRFLGYCSHTENKAIKINGSGKCGKYIYPEERERLLCFEYINKGSLHNHITDELSGLEWHTRYQVIKGICMGLQYLHKERDIVHMDLKPDNILIDDLMVPKITDFGISKHLDGISKAVTKVQHMSLGYCAPEYLHGGYVSFKSDIYSLGVIIKDLVTGRKEDPDVRNVLRRWRHRWNSSAKYPPLGYQEVTKCIEIAVRCMSHDAKTRPDISNIVLELNETERMSEHIDNANESTFSLISPYPWELLDIDPLELRFPFEVGKQIPCSLQLTNLRDDYVAFYIQASSGRYCVEPIRGTVPPNSKMNVTITLQAQKTAPPQRSHYTDEFVVRCTAMNDNLATENITQELFDEKLSEVVDNVNVTVAFLTRC